MPSEVSSDASEVLVSSVSEVIAALEVSSEVEVWPVEVTAVELVAVEVEAVEVDVCVEVDVAALVPEEVCAVDVWLVEELVAVLVVELVLAVV
jgi:hypothetical protein